MDGQAGRAALVLTGGGARAAYQVGVLNAIRELRGKRAGNPFPILCGTSAGAINAVALAVHAGDFGRAVRHIDRIWRGLHVHDVYRVDPAALLGSGLRWGSALFTGWLVRQTPRALLDNTPLQGLLGRALDLAAIGPAIKRGDLHAVSVTASGYSTGESLAFFQGSIDILPWRRTQRLGVRSELRVDHLMASSALPFVFPAVKINREFFGDGSMRQLAPGSPAIHLGADRILVIGAGRTAEEGRVRVERYPSPAQIAGHALSSIFLDTLEVDLESLARINETLDEALAEWRKLDGSIREQFKKKLAERLENPRVPAAKLSGSTDRYKIKLRASGYRLVYEVHDRTVTVVVLVVGRRDSIYESTNRR